MHIVPPHGVVFEIRVYDGYGARWSQDGTKVCIINFQFGSKLFYIYLNSVLYTLIWSNVHEATLSTYELDFTINLSQIDSITYFNTF